MGITAYNFMIERMRLLSGDEMRLNEHNTPPVKKSSPRRSFIKNNEKDRFKLLIPLNNHLVGTIFDSFGGLVSGVDGIPFTNEGYFKLVK